MKIPKLREFTKSQPINIFHLEDEGDWLEVVQDNILSKLKWSFNYHFCTTLDELREKLNGYPDLSILIADLKLAKPLDDVQGLAWLLRNIDALRNNQVEIFVLSGYLRGPASRYNRFLLEYNHLSSDHLFDKAKFYEDRFLEALEAAALRLLKAAAKPWDQAPEDSLFALDACMVNVSLVDNVHQVQQGRTYLVDVEITALRDLSYLTRKSLKVYVYSLEANVSPEINELQIPKKPYVYDYVRFEVFFEIKEAPPLRDMFVAVFYGNNLLRLFEMRVKVERASGNETDMARPHFIREYV